jgi:hypothetical protein
MKRIFNYISVIILVSASIISCDNFLDVNTDPTRLKSASLTQALVAAESSVGFNTGADVFLYSSIFMQQGAGSGVSGNQTRMMDQYVVANSDVNNAFREFYAVGLADMNYIHQNAFKDGNPQHAGIAKILKAYSFSVITDAWGNVPYKDALQGVANVQPAYDDSQVIYDSLFTLLDNAIVNIKQTNFLTIGSEDLIYAGSMAKWEKFANTLKLRLALHYAKVDNGAKLKAIIDSGVPFMTGNADNFQMAFENVTNRQNAIHQFELQRADYYAPGKFIVDMMNTKLDPRRSAYFTQFPFDTPAAIPYTGFTPGNTQSAPNSRIHTYLRGAVVSTGTARTAQGAPTAIAITYTGAAPQRMLTFAEYNFIRAEASLVYGATGSAATFLKAGIDASLADAGITGAAATAYSAAASATVTLQNIIEEKYVANYGVAMEPWTDWRRTGFPAITVSPAAVVQGNNTIPRILVYPLSESQVNAANLPARASMAVKGVFWDK